MKYYVSIVRKVMYRASESLLNKPSSFETRPIIRHVTTPTKLTFSMFGDPGTVITKENFVISDQLEGRQVLVKMLTAAINPSDLNTIQGVYGVKPPLPCVPGNEGVGCIDKVGSDVSTLKKGDWVIPQISFSGTWRSHVIESESAFRKIPNDLPLPFASTMTINPCTAYRMLLDYVDLKDGEVVIQNGANSAVGQNVIQLCKYKNIKTVNIVRDRPDIKELKLFLTKMGATVVLTEEELRTTDIFKTCEVENPVLAFNCVGGKSATEIIRHMARGSTMVTYGGMSKQPVTIGTASLIFKDIRVVGYWMTQWRRDHVNDPKVDEMYEDIAAFAKEGVLQPPVTEFVLLDNYKIALEKSGNAEGFAGKKYILKFDD